MGELIAGLESEVTPGSRFGCMVWVHSLATPTTKLTLGSSQFEANFVPSSLKPDAQSCPVDAGPLHLRIDASRDCRPFGREF